MNAAEGTRQLLMLLREFGPEQLGRVKGMTEQRVHALETDIQRQFCTGHRALLLNFGATPRGAFRPALYDYKFDERAIRDYYRTHPDEDFPGWLFWADIGGGYPLVQHVYSDNVDVEDPGIGSPVLDRIEGESMWNDLIFSAYVFLIDDKFEEAGPGGWLWQGREIPRSEASEPFAMVQRILERIGFEPWIDMANFQAMMRRGDVIVWFGRTGTRPDPDEWNFSISGPDPRELREVREILADNVGAVERPIRNR